MAVVLITGGSSGIGLATVERLSAAGHTVFAASRRPGRAAVPEGVTALSVDVADPDAAALAVGSVVDAAGRLDVLVNNAGAGDLGPLEEMSDADAHRIFEVNLFGPMRLAGAAIAVMREGGGGRIINVTSMNDVLPAPFGGWYSASKAALASASRVLDAEVGQFGITVTVVAPGLFRTAMSEALTSYSAAPESPYRAAFDALRVQNERRMGEAADPAVVAAAIEGVIDAAEPPSRVVVGSDAQSMEKLVASVSPDELARLMRGFVARLTSGE